MMTDAVEKGCGPGKGFAHGKWAFVLFLILILLFFGDC